MSVTEIEIPTAAELVAVGTARADELFAAKKHSKQLTPAGAVKKREALLRECVEADVAEIRGEVLSRYQWSYAQIMEDSPTDIANVPVRHHPGCLLGLFDPSDIVWCGAVYEMAEQNFRTPEQWIKAGVPPQYTCPSTFKAGSTSRKKENLVTRRYLVVESDVLDRNTVGAVFQWLIQENGLNLRAIVDTAGKSLHGWFEVEGLNLDELKLVLPPLGCDRRMFVDNQPCRMPGASRDGKFQRLIYLDPLERDE